MRIQCTKKFPLECRARWNSTYLMLSVALEYREVFKMLVDKDSLYQSCSAAEDWDLASDIRCRLRIFYNVTELFSERKYPASNDYFSHVCEIKLALLRWLSCNVVAIKEMARPMLEKFNKYWETMNGMVGIATTLDPRYKTTSLRFYYTKFDKTMTDAQVERMKQNCSRLVDEYEEREATHHLVGTLVHNAHLCQ